MEQVEDNLLIFGIENPLMDISLVVKDDEILTKYEIVMNTACLASEKQIPIYEEIWNTEGHEVMAGGSTLNTIRAANFALKDTHPGKCGFFGCIGKDEYGKVLEEELAKTGVKGNFHKTDDAPTGTCAVLIKNKDRALCANLAACLQYPTYHLADNLDTVRGSTLIYTSAFFITSNFEALIQVARLAAEENKPLGYNLSAGFLIQFNTEQVNTVLEYADYVFCNEDEAKIFAEVNNLGKDISTSDIALALAQWKKTNEKRHRVAIITCGSNPTVYAQKKEGEDTYTTHTQEVHPIPHDEIVDLNGAGDSFVGGFLAGIVTGKDLVASIKQGSHLAGIVIKRSGCAFPEKFEYNDTQ